MPIENILADWFVAVLQPLAEPVIGAFPAAAQEGAALIWAQVLGAALGAIGVFPL